MSALISHHQLTGLGLSPTDAFDYLLIDGVKMEPVLNWVYQNIENPEWYPLYKNTRYNDVIDLSPCLVRVPADSDITYQFEHELGPQGVAIWLRSYQAVDVLGAHLSRLLWITTEEGQYLHYRFYDPASLSKLTPELTSEESAKLYHGVERITWFDAAQGLWKQMSVPQKEPQSSPSAGVVFKPEWISATLKVS